MSDFQFVAIPNFQQAQPAQPINQSRLYPPVRVRTAMEYLHYTVMKQLKRAAVNDISIEVIHGQQLSRAEMNARESAANLINDYFNGRVEADQWEQGELESTKEKSKRLMGGSTGAIMTCIACGHNPRPNCAFCKGSGEVIMFPNKSE